MCKGSVHTTRGCLKLLNLKIQYLQKEVEVQSRIIKQWKALYESSQVKHVQECHVNCKIDHSRYNYVAKFQPSQPPLLDAQEKIKENENWYMFKGKAIWRDSPVK